MGRRNHGQRNIEGWRPTSRRKQVELLRKRDLQTLIAHVDDLHKGHNLAVCELAALKQLVVEELARLIGERTRSGVLILPHGNPGLSTVEQLTTRLDRIRLEIARQLLAREDTCAAEQEPAPTPLSTVDAGGVNAPAA